MIFDISSDFQKIFDNEQLYLPIRWDGNDFIATLDKLYHLYQSRINETINNNETIIYYERIKTVCSLLGLV